MALLSRLPLQSSELRAVGQSPLRGGTLASDERPLAVSVIHTASPIDAARTALRDRKLDTLSPVAGEFNDHDLIIMGDFNTSPW